MLGKHHSEETRRKMSIERKGIKNSMFGRHLSEETKRKKSEAMKGDKNHNYGKKFSEEHKRKIGEAQKGEKHWNWKGGQITSSQGYVLVLMPEHPRARKDGYIKRARLVAEKKLGRYLYPSEITHHKNEIRDDDRPEKIEVMTRGKHQSLHRKIQELGRKHERFGTN